jgi:hypothetical protein
VLVSGVVENTLLKAATACLLDSLLISLHSSCPISSQTEYPPERKSRKKEGPFYPQEVVTRAYTVRIHQRMHRFVL